jgi:hypothetical protein
MLIFVLHFYFGLNFEYVLFWFFIFGIVNHIAILAMLVVTLYYILSNLRFKKNYMLILGSCESLLLSNL